MNNNEIDYKLSKHSIKYFAENNFYYNTYDEGPSTIILRPYQEHILDRFLNRRNVIVKGSRQIGKTLLNHIFLQHYLTFNKNKTVVVFFDKELIGRMFMERLQYSIKMLPKHYNLIPEKYSKDHISFNNGNNIFVTNDINVCSGHEVDLLILDEFAFVAEKRSQEIVDSVFPELNARKNAKIIISSTRKSYNPKGVFNCIWEDSIGRKNNFTPILVNWDVDETRDDDWRNELIKMLGQEQFEKEFVYYD